MGTRNLTCVVLDGEYKVAQYGQWDGYPEGQGKTVLEFLEKYDRQLFESKVRASSFSKEEELEALGDKWLKVYPQHSRDVGADILAIIQSHDAGIKLRNTISFAADSLMCEWVYVIDLDRNNFEVFKGFNKEPLKEKDRFFTLEIPKGSNGYHQVKLVKSYYLSELPTLDQLVADCCPADETEEV